MVTSRIPAYSLNSEFNREFRSFRISRATPRSTLYAPAIVPIHEYPRVSVHERREALKAALAKAWSSKSCEKKKHDTWSLSNDHVRTAVTSADFSAQSHTKNGFSSHEATNVPVNKKDYESKNLERNETVETNGRPASFNYGRVDGNGINIQDTLKNGCDKGLHNKDLGYTDFLNNVPKCKSSFENNFLKQSHEERYNKRNGYDVNVQRVDKDINRNNIEYSNSNGDLHDSLKYSRNANGTESAQHKHYCKGDIVKSKLISVENARVATCSGEKPNGYAERRPLTSGPKAVVEQRLAERLEVKAAELPALYLGVEAWTPKSAAFQRSMREHEWSVSYVLPQKVLNTLILLTDPYYILCVTYERLVYVCATCRSSMRSLTAHALD